MDINLLILCVMLVTYFWRAIGALAAGRVRAHSPVFNAAACIVYAIVGSLIIKLIIYPQGAAAETLLPERLLAISAVLAVYAVSRSVPLASWTGVFALLFLISDWSSTIVPL